MTCNFLSFFTSLTSSFLVISQPIVDLRISASTESQKEILKSINEDLCNQSCMMRKSRDEIEGIMNNFFSKDEIVFACGGSSAVTSLLLSKMGMNVSLLLPLSDDKYGQFLSKTFSEAGIQTILTEKSCQTGICLCLSDPLNDRKVLLTALESTSPFYPKNGSFKDLCKKFDYVLFDGYTIEFGREFIDNVRDASESGAKVCIVSCDGAFLKKHVNIMRESIVHADVFICNGLEACILTDCDNPLEAQLELRNRIKKDCILAVTNGSEPVYVSKCSERNNIGIFVVKPEKLDVSSIKNTTSGGDSFATGFLLGLSQGMDIEISTNIGNIIARNIIAQESIQKINIEEDSIVKIKEEIYSTMQ